MGFVERRTRALQHVNEASMCRNYFSSSFFFFFHIVARTISLKHSKLQSFFCSDIFPLSRRLNEAREKKNCNKTIATIATTTATTKSQTTAAIFLLLNCERLRCSTVGVIFAFQVWTVPPNDLFHSYSHTRTHIHTHTFILFCSLFLSFSLSRYTFNSSLSLPFHVPRTI